MKRCWVSTWALFQYPIRRPIVRFREVSKPRDWWLKQSHRFGNWQASRRQCCRGACQIWEWSGILNTNFVALRLCEILQRTYYRILKQGPVNYKSWSRIQMTLFVGCVDTLQWRNYKRDDVSNHRCLDCLLDRLFRRRSKKTSKLRVTDICEGNPTVTGVFPHKGPLTRKMLRFDDVIM